MENLKEKIIEKIEKGEVKKKPFWYFLTKKYFVWTSFVLAIFLGAVAFSLFLLNYFDDFGPWYRLRNSSEIIFSKIFLIWILVFLVFVALTIFNFKQTKKAFRFEIWKIVLLSLAGIVFLGFGIYKINCAQKIDNFLAHKSQKYLNLKNERKKEIEKILAKNGISPSEFFKNSQIISLEKKWKKIDEERVQKIKNILESLKGRLSEEKIKGLKRKIQEIKDKKKELDLLRLEKEVEIFKNNMLK